MRRNRFLYLFCALLILLVTPPVSLGPRLHLSSFLFAVLILTAVFAVSERRSTIILASALALPSIFFQFYEEPGKVIQVGVHCFTIALLIVTIVPILRFVFRCRFITFNEICAALCVYLLVGLIWAMAYSLYEYWVPGSFVLPDGKRLTVDDGSAVYFSYVTLTTLGYGDIQPSSPGAQRLATLEAIVGQCYLTVIVAWLVGLYVARFSQGDGQE